MSFFDDIISAGKSAIGWISGAVNTVERGFLDFGNVISGTALTAWKASSGTAKNVAESAAGVGMAVGEGLKTGTNQAIEYAKIGVDETSKNVVAAVEYIYGQVCDIAMGAAISGVFVTLSSNGEENSMFGPLKSACQSSDKTAIKSACDDLAIKLADPISSIPGVLTIVRSKKNLETALSWAINKAANDQVKSIVGGDVQIIGGIVITLVTNLVCHGKFPSGSPVAWSNVENTPIEQISGNAKAVYPEGARINFGAPGIYLILDGKARHIPDVATYNNLFVTWDKQLSANINTVLPAPPITKGAYLAKTSDSDRVYLIIDGVKRWIVSPEAFNRYYFDSSKIRIVASAVLNGIPSGKNLYSITLKEGTRVKMGSDTYLVLDGVARHIPSTATYNRLFPDWNGIIEYDTTELIGTELVGKALSDYACLCRIDNGSKIYLVSNGLKRWISSAPAFNKYRFDWSKVTTIMPSGWTTGPVTDGPQINL